LLTCQPVKEYCRAGGTGTGALKASTVSEGITVPLDVAEH
jgi:hypothetical protein